MPLRQSQEASMPEVVFYALGGRSVEQKRALVKDFTDAVVKNYKVDPSAVTITIVESQGEGRRAVLRHGCAELGCAEELRRLGGRGVDRRVVVLSSD
jgi:4-oxalocrotonate tautomerase